MDLVFLGLAIVFFAASWAVFRLASGKERP
jgi:hypothetical protein